MSANNQKTALVMGGGGFIGHHMINRLKKEGYWVRSVDLKYPEFEETKADHFVIRDLRDAREVKELIGYAGCARSPHQIYNQSFDKPFDEIYQFAADMGGAGYIFTGEHDADVMHNSATINLNVLDAVREHTNKCLFNPNNKNQANYPKIFYSSSACIYPEEKQTDTDNPGLKESDAYPAHPDSEYGWEKLFSERLYFSYARNYGIPVYVGRFHNIYGPLGTWKGGKEKAPAAICRKVAEAVPGGEIEIWGDGNQTRSFLYISDCIEAVRMFISQDDFHGPINIGSDQMVSINELVHTVSVVAKKPVTIKHIDGPLGVRGRNSDNTLIWDKFQWVHAHTLREGIKPTYDWIERQVNETTT